MSYSLITLWYERQRYLPGVLAVAFSALLIALQCGLLLGLFSITSIPIDHANADVWVATKNVVSVDLAQPIPKAWLGRVETVPGVERADIYAEGFTYWNKPGGGRELCNIIGTRLEDGGLGMPAELTPELRALLTEPGSVVVDASELERLGVQGVGDTAEVSGRRVRVVGLVHGLKSLAGPYVFCSVETAEPLLHLLPGQTTYLLARCRPGIEPATVVQQLRDYPEMSAFTSAEFSLRTRLHWLIKTKGGIALGCAAALGLLVGAVVTSQTLYAATAAAMREFAVLRALGIPRWRMAAMVLSQSFWVGVLGIALGLAAIAGLAPLADLVGARVLLPAWLLAAAAAVTLVMALLSGLASLRSLRLLEPTALLR